MNSDFDIVPDPKGLYVHVKYPGEEKIRYTIDLLKWDCTCQGFTIAQAKAKKAHGTPKNCKHLEDVVFRIRNAGFQLRRILIKGEFTTD